MLYFVSFFFARNNSLKTRLQWITTFEHLTDATPPKNMYQTNVYN